MKSNLFALNKMHNKQFIKITFQLAGQTGDSFALMSAHHKLTLFRSGDIVIKRRLSSEERRRPSAVEECRKLTNSISTSGGSLGSDYQRWLSKSDTWSRHHRGAGGAEGGATDQWVGLYCC